MHACMYVHMCGHGCVPVEARRQQHSLELTTGGCELHDVSLGGKLQSSVRAANPLHPCTTFPAPT